MPNEALLIGALVLSLLTHIATIAMIFKLSTERRNLLDENSRLGVLLEIAHRDADRYYVELTKEDDDANRQ